MKKVTAILTSALMLIMGCMTFASCGKEGGGNERLDEKRVMNLSCNPSVEFVLDADDKVVSVNALNEEGNLILTAETFVGKDAETAAKLFVEVSKETGFLVSGNATNGEDQISVSLSGDAETATKLYNEIKGTVNEYLTAENIQAQLTQAQAITEERLRALVAECSPYIEQAKIQAMSRLELIEAVYESRKETAEFYSQELKNAYYEAKAFAMEQAEIEVLKSKVSELAQVGIEFAYKMYETAVKTVEDTRAHLLVDPDSAYQVALTDFRNKKIEYLQYRESLASKEESLVTEAMKTALSALEGAVDIAETGLLNAGASANATLDLAKNAAKTQYDAVIKAIEDASVKVSDHLTAISEKQKEEKEKFFTAFKDSYASAIAAAKSDWDEMKEQLEEQPEASA